MVNQNRVGLRAFRKIQFGPEEIPGVPVPATIFMVGRIGMELDQKLYQPDDYATRRIVSYEHTRPIMRRASMPFESDATFEQLPVLLDMAIRRSNVLEDRNDPDTFLRGDGSRIIIPAVVSIGGLENGVYDVDAHINNIVYVEVPDNVRFLNGSSPYPAAPIIKVLGNTPADLRTSLDPVSGAIDEIIIVDGNFDLDITDLPNPTGLSYDAHNPRNDIFALRNRVNENSNIILWTLIAELIPPSAKVRLTTDSGSITNIELISGGDGYSYDIINPENNINQRKLLSPDGIINISDIFSGFNDRYARIEMSIGLTDVIDENKGRGYVSSIDLDRTGDTILRGTGFTDGVYYLHEFHRDPMGFSVYVPGVGGSGLAPYTINTNYNSVYGHISLVKRNYDLKYRYEYNRDLHGGEENREKRLQLYNTRTYTVEYGDDIIGRRSTFVSCEKLEFNGQIDDVVKIRADLFGQDVEDLTDIGTPNIYEDRNVSPNQYINNLLTNRYRQIFINDRGLNDYLDVIRRPAYYLPEGDDARKAPTYFSRKYMSSGPNQNMPPSDINVDNESPDKTGPYSDVLPPSDLEPLVVGNSEFFVYDRGDNGAWENVEENPGYRSAPSGRGSGYISPPSVNIAGGGGTGATAKSYIYGSVDHIDVTNRGSDYSVDNPPDVFIEYPSFPGGRQAKARAVVVGEKIAEIIIVDAGSGYTVRVNPTIVISGGGGSGATADAFVFDGEVYYIEVTNGGSNYTSVPTVDFGSGGGGSGAIATAVISDDGRVVAVNLGSAIPSTLISFSYIIETGLSPVKYINDDISYSDIVEGKRHVELNITAAFNKNVANWFEDWYKGYVKEIRNTTDTVTGSTTGDPLAGGGAIGIGSPSIRRIQESRVLELRFYGKDYDHNAGVGKLLSLQINGKLVEYSSLSEREEQNIVSLKFLSEYDEEGGRDFRVILVNNKPNEYYGF